jgi:NADH-quinone oxidoreductase subunit N
MFNVVISLYYYLRVLKAAYFRTPLYETPGPRLTPPLKAIAVAMIVIMIVGGLYPQHMIAVADAITRGLILKG